MFIDECQTPRPGFPKPVPAISDKVFEQFKLTGQTVVVNGAADGIGLAVAEAMAEAGANVAMWYNSNDAAIKKAEEIAYDASSTLTNTTYFDHLAKSSESTVPSHFTEC